jgi:hypothetical protein
VYCDRQLPRGVTSPRQIAEKKNEPFPEGYGVTWSNVDRANPLPSYVQARKGLRIFDTRTGTQHFAFSEYSGCLMHYAYGCSWRTILPLDYEPEKLLSESEPASGNQTPDLTSSKQRTRFLHIPSKRWIDVEGLANGFQEIPGGHGQNSARWIAYGHNYPYREADNQEAPVWETAPDGTTRQIGVLPMKGQTTTLLIPGSFQVAQVVEDVIQLPDWLRGFLYRRGWLTEWIERKSGRVYIYDYQWGNSLWSDDLPQRGKNEIAVTPTGSFLLITRESDTGNEVSVIPLPLSNWSSWWARISGVVAFSLSLFLLYRLRIKANLKRNSVEIAKS